MSQEMLSIDNPSDWNAIVGAIAGIRQVVAEGMKNEQTANDDRELCFIKLSEAIIQARRAAAMEQYRSQQPGNGIVKPS